MILHSSATRQRSGGPALNMGSVLQQACFRKPLPWWRRHMGTVKIGLVGLAFGTCLLTIIYLVGVVQEKRLAMSLHMYDLHQTEQALKAREMEIARIVATQYGSPRDIVEIGKAVSTILSTAQNSKQRAFLEQALPFAIHMQVQKRIPASGLVAQAIYESAYGQSELARTHHNYFGLKTGSTWEGQVAQDQLTRDSGVLVRADFRSYSTLEDGFRDYAEKISHDHRYRSAFQYTRGDQFVGRLLECGYCPDRDYLSNIRTIIARHKLSCLENLLLDAKAQPSMPLLSQATFPQGSMGVER